MDLRQDRYLCLDRRNSLMLQTIGVASRDNGYRNAAELSKYGASIVRALANRGLLASRESQGKSLELTLHRLPEQSLAISSLQPRNAFHWRFLCSFLAACLVTSYQLRATHIERTVRTVSRRKSHQKNVHAAFALADLVHIFSLLRPLYPREYLCLFDSLCLVHFLAHFRHHPEWIFGVKLEPFGAHCWVQSGDTVLNDAAEVVRQYTPILVV